MPIKRFNNISNPEVVEETEVKFEYSLRPSRFSEVIGRQKEKSTLEMMIKSATKSGSSLDHIIFHGPPGLGKTSLAHVVAKEMAAEIQVTSGPAITKQGDLAALLTSLKAGTILFIDEIHRLGKHIEEILYPAMEDMVLDIMMGKGNGSKNIRIELEPFTIIAATTRIGLISKPLLDRFGIDLRLDYYSTEEMAELVKQKSQMLRLEIAEEAAFEIARRARRTPRIAVKILKRVRDNAIANSQQKITLDLVRLTLDLLEIDDEGLDYLDRKILQVIWERFAGGPVGVGSIAAALSEEVDTLADVYEPYLIQEGFIVRTAQGRKLTDKGIKHIDSNK